MSFADPAPAKDRVRVAIVVAVLHAALGYALLTGLTVQLPQRMSDSLSLFAVLPPASRPPPPPPPQRHHAKAPRREGAAAPPNLAAKATAVVAPPPVVVIPLPPPVIAAPIAGIGTADHAGAAPIVGPGSGSGGVGDGTGSGDDGDGEGGGGGGRELEFLSGIRDSDYPQAAFAARIGGTVGVRFTVGVKGRVTDCATTSSSGNRELDAATCPLILKRLRYRPRLDRTGRAVPTVIEGSHVWTVHDRANDEGDGR